MKKQYPKTLYALIEESGTKDEYLHTEESLERLVDVGETVTVAEYKLVHTFKVKGEAVRV